MRQKAPPATIPAPCDLCGCTDWEYLFTETRFDLGRCRRCGLHYVAQMPRGHMTNMEAGHFSDVTPVSASIHLEGEKARKRDFQQFVDLLRRFAPSGRWLDIGCGTGIFMQVVKSAGVEIDGIELSADRRAVAQIENATIYDRPLEALKLPSSSLAAITLINVFSHLISPTETLADIHRVLMPNGVVLVHTGEIGPGVQKHHLFHWALGDHLAFLGEGTIERYAKKLRYELVYRDRVWLPATRYTRARFARRGRSRIRDLAKSVILYTPGAFPLLRWYMLRRPNPIYTATLVLKKV